MATNNVSVGLGLTLDTTQYAKALQQTNSKTGAVFKELDAQAENFAARWEDITRNIRSTKSVVSSLVLYSTFTGIADAAGMAASAIASFSMNMETAQVAMQYFMDGTDKAAKSLEYLREMQQVAADTSFTTESAVGLSKFMASMGVDIRSVKSVMTTINDAAAATGASEANMERIVTALGQILTKGRLAAEEVRQLANANIPIYDILKEEMDLTGTEIANLGNMWLDANDSVVAILTGLQKRYKGAAADVANTVSGMTNSIKDNALMIGHVASSGIYDTFSEKLRIVRDELNKYRSIAVDQGSTGLFRSFVLGADSTGRFGTQLIALVGNFRELIDAGKELYITCEPLVNMFFEGFYYSISTLTLGIRALGETLNGTNAILKTFGIDLKDVFEVCAGVYIVYRVGHTFGYVGQMAATLVVHLRKTYLGMVELLPASVAASTGLKILTGSILVGGAAVLYLSGALDKLIEGFAGLSAADGLPSDFESAFDAYMKQMDEYNAAIKEYEGTFDESFESIANKGIGAFEVIQEKAKKSAKKASESWLASFDEVYKVPEDKDTTDNDKLTFPDLAALVDKLQYIFPAHIEEELIMPSFDWNKVYDNSDATLSALKSWTPLLLTGLSFSMAHAFKKRYKDEVEKQQSATGPKKSPSGAEDGIKTTKNAQEKYEAATSKVTQSIDDATDLLSKKVTDVSASQVTSLESTIKKANKELIAAAEALGISTDDVTSPILDRLDTFAKAQEVQRIDTQLSSIYKQLEETYATRKDSNVYAQLLAQRDSYEKKLTKLLTETDISAYYTPQSALTAPTFDAQFTEIQSRLDRLSVEALQTGKTYNASLISRIQTLLDDVDDIRRTAKKLDLLSIVEAIEQQRSALDTYAKSFGKLNSLYSIRQARSTGQEHFMQSSDEIEHQIATLEKHVRESLDTLKVSTRTVVSDTFTDATAKIRADFNKALDRVADKILPEARKFNDTLAAWQGQGVDDLLLQRAQKLADKVESGQQQLIEAVDAYTKHAVSSQVRYASGLPENRLSVDKVLKTVEQELPQLLLDVFDESTVTSFTKDILQELHSLGQNILTSTQELDSKTLLVLNRILNNGGAYRSSAINALSLISDNLEAFKTNALQKLDLEDLPSALNAAYLGDTANTAYISRQWEKGAGSINLGAEAQTLRAATQDTAIRKAFENTAQQITQQLSTGKILTRADAQALFTAAVSEQAHEQARVQLATKGLVEGVEEELEYTAGLLQEAILGKEGLQKTFAKLYDILPDVISNAAQQGLDSARSTVQHALNSIFENVAQATSSLALDNLATAQQQTFLGFNDLGNIRKHIKDFMSVSTSLLATQQIPLAAVTGYLNDIRSNTLDIAARAESLYASRGISRISNNATAGSALLDVRQLEEDVRQIADYISTAAFGSAQDQPQIARMLAETTEAYVNTYLTKTTEYMVTVAQDAATAITFLGKETPGASAFSEITFAPSSFTQAIDYAISRVVPEDLQDAVEGLLELPRSEQLKALAQIMHSDITTANKQLLSWLDTGIETYIAEGIPKAYEPFYSGLSALVKRLIDTNGAFDSVTLANTLGEQLKLQVKPVINELSGQISSSYIALDKFTPDEHASDVLETFQRSARQVAADLSENISLDTIQSRRLVELAQNTFNEIRNARYGGKSLEAFTERMEHLIAAQATPQEAQGLQRLLDMYTSSGAFTGQGRIANTYDRLASHVDALRTEAFYTYRSMLSGNNASNADWLASVHTAQQYSPLLDYMHENIVGRQAAFQDLELADIISADLETAFNRTTQAIQDLPASALLLFKKSGFFAGAGSMDVLASGKGLAGTFADTLAAALEPSIAQSLNLTLPEKTHRRLFNEFRGEVIEKLRLNDIGQVVPVVGDLNAYNSITNTKAQLDALGEVPVDNKTGLPIEIKSTSRHYDYEQLVAAMRKQSIVYVDTKGIHEAVEDAASNAIQAYLVDGEALQQLKAYDANLFYQLGTESATLDTNKILVSITHVPKELDEHLTEMFNTLETERLGKLPTYIGGIENVELSAAYLESLAEPLTKQWPALQGTTLTLLVDITDEMRKEVEDLASTYQKVLLQIARNTDKGISIGDQLVTLLQSGENIGGTTALRRLTPIGSLPRNFGLSDSVNKFFRRAQELILNADFQPQRSRDLLLELRDLRDTLTRYSQSAPVVPEDKKLARTLLLESNELGALDVSGVTELDFYRPGGLLEDLITRVDALIGTQSTLYLRAQEDLNRLPSALKALQQQGYAVHDAFFIDGAKIENYLRGFQSTLKHLSDVTTGDTQKILEDARKLISQIANNQVNIVELADRIDGRLANLHSVLQFATPEGYLNFLQNMQPSNAAAPELPNAQALADAQRQIQLGVQNKLTSVEEEIRRLEAAQLENNLKLTEAQAQAGSAGIPALNNSAVRQLIQQQNSIESELSKATAQRTELQNQLAAITGNGTEQLKITEQTAEATKSTANSVDAWQRLASEAANSRIDRLTMQAGLNASEAAISDSILTGFGSISFDDAGNLAGMHISTLSDTVGDAVSAVLPLGNTGIPHAAAGLDDVIDAVQNSTRISRAYDSSFGTFFKGLSDDFKTFWQGLGKSTQKAGNNFLTFLDSFKNSPRAIIRSMRADDGLVDIFKSALKDAGTSDIFKAATAPSDVILKNLDELIDYTAKAGTTTMGFSKSYMKAVDSLVDELGLSTEQSRLLKDNFAVLLDHMQLQDIGIHNTSAAHVLDNYASDKLYKQLTELSDADLSKLVKGADDILAQYAKTEKLYGDTLIEALRLSEANPDKSWDAIFRQASKNITGKAGTFNGFVPLGAEGVTSANIRLQHYIPKDEVDIYNAAVEASRNLRNSESVADFIDLWQKAGQGSPSEELIASLKVSAEDASKVLDAQLDNLQATKSTLLAKQDALNNELSTLEKAMQNASPDEAIKYGTRIAEVQTELSKVADDLANTTRLYNSSSDLLTAAQTLAKGEDIVDTIRFGPAEDAVKAFTESLQNARAASAAANAAVASTKGVANADNFAKVVASNLTTLDNAGLWKTLGKTVGSKLLTGLQYTVKFLFSDVLGIGPMDIISYAIEWVANNATMSSIQQVAKTGSANYLMSSFGLSEEAAKKVNKDMGRTAAIDDWWSTHGQTVGSIGTQAVATVGTSIAGAIIQSIITGAGIGAAGTSWTGPGAIIGGIVGGIVSGLGSSLMMADGGLSYYHNYSGTVRDAQRNYYDNMIDKGYSDAEARKYAAAAIRDDEIRTAFSVYDDKMAYGGSIFSWFEVQELNEYAKSLAAFSDAALKSADYGETNFSRGLWTQGFQSFNDLSLQAREAFSYWESEGVDDFKAAIGNAESNFDALRGLYSAYLGAEVNIIQQSMGQHNDTIDAAMNEMLSDLDAHSDLYAMKQAAQSYTLGEQLLSLMSGTEIDFSKMSESARVDAYESLTDVYKELSKQYAIDNVIAPQIANLLTEQLNTNGITFGSIVGDGSAVVKDMQMLADYLDLTVYSFKDLTKATQDAAKQIDGLDTDKIFAYGLSFDSVSGKVDEALDSFRNKLAGWTVSLPGAIDVSTLSASDLQILASAGIEITTDGVTLAQAQTAGESGAERDLLIDYDTTSKRERETLSKEVGIDLSEDGAKLNTDFIDKNIKEAYFDINQSAFGNMSREAASLFAGYKDIYSATKKDTLVDREYIGEGLGYYDATTGQLAITNSAILRGEKTIEDWLAEMDPNHEYFNDALYDGLLALSKEIKDYGYREVANGATWNITADTTNQLGDITKTGIAGVTFSEYGDEGWVATASNLGELAAQGFNRILTTDYDKLVDSNEEVIKGLEDLGIKITRGDLYTTFDISDTIKKASGDNTLLGLYSYVPELISELSPAMKEFLQKTGRLDEDNGIINWQQQRGSTMVQTEWGGTYTATQFLPDNYLASFETMKDTAGEAIDTAKLASWEMIQFSGLTSEEVGSVQNDVDTIVLSFDQIPNQVLYDYARATGIISDETGDWTVDTIKNCDAVREKVAGMKLDEAAAESFADSETVFTETIDKWREAMKSAQPGLSEDAYGLGSVIAAAIEQGLQNGMNGIQLSLDTQNALNNVTIKGTDTRSGDMSDVNVNGIATSRKAIGSYGLTDDTGKAVYVNSFNFVEPSDHDVKLHFNGSWYIVNNTTNPDSAVEQLEAFLKHDGTLQSSDDLKYNSNGYIEYVPGKKTTGYANGGILDEDGLYRVAEQNRAEAIIPLENPNVSAHIGAAMANMLVASNEWRKLAAVQGIRDGGISTRLADERYERNMQREMSDSRDFEQMADTILQRIIPAISQSQSRTEEDNRTPVYVGTLIANDEGIRELNKRMRVVEARETRRR